MNGVEGREGVEGGGEVVESDRRVGGTRGVRMMAWCCGRVTTVGGKYQGLGW